MITIYLIFLLPIVSSAFQTFDNFNNKCKRTSKRLMAKIKYCPYLKNQKNYIVYRYNQTNISMNKKIRYLKVINRKKMKNIYDQNLIDETISRSSSNISDELVEEIKESLAFLIDINKEYSIFLSLIITEIIKQKLNQNLVSNVDLHKKIQTIIIRNILIPMAIHDIYHIFFTVIFKH